MSKKYINEHIYQDDLRKDQRTEIKKYLSKYTEVKGSIKKYRIENNYQDGLIVTIGSKKYAVTDTQDFLKAYKELCGVTILCGVKEF